MPTIFWFATVLLASAAFIFREAPDQISVGADWAYKACKAAPIFCQHPEYLAYAAGVTAVLAIAVKISEATS